VTVEVLRVERPSESVYTEEIEPAVADEGGDGRHRLEHLLDRRPELLPRGLPPSLERRGLRRAREIEQVSPLGLVELQRLGERFEHRLGDAAEVAALEPCVVVGRDARQERDLLATEALHASWAGAVGAQSRLFRSDPGATRGEELADLASRVHASTVTRLRPR